MDGLPFCRDAIAIPYHSPCVCDSPASIQRPPRIVHVLTHIHFIANLPLTLLFQSSLLDVIVISNSTYVSLPSSVDCRVTNHLFYVGLVVQITNLRRLHYLLQQTLVLQFTSSTQTQCYKSPLLRRFSVTIHQFCVGFTTFFSRLQFYKSPILGRLHSLLQQTAVLKNTSSTLD